MGGLIPTHPPELGLFRMKIAIASDHAAFALKAELAAWLAEAGHEVTDLGPDSEASVDYPDFGYALGQHVAARVAGQVDACYTLEPTGTIGRMNGTTRVIEAGVVAKYILGDAMAPWHGGAACLTTEFIKKNPDVAKKFIAAYTRGIELVRTKPAEARTFMKGYTAIEGALTSEVPLASYMLYNEFKPSDVAYFQKFYDLFTEKGIFDKKVLVDGLLYKD